MSARRVVIIGAGVNAVTVLEQGAAPGGGVSSRQDTLPGFVHDPCAGFFPLTAASPAFRGLGLERHSLERINPDVPMVHPFLDGSAIALHRDVGARCQPRRCGCRRRRQLAAAGHTAAGPGRSRHARRAEHVPAGRCRRAARAAPAPRRARARAAHARLGGEPGPRALRRRRADRVAVRLGGALGPRARRYGLGTFKVDWALSQPVPGSAPEAPGAAVVHLGDTVDAYFDAAHESAVGRVPANPPLVVGQQSLHDATRAPEGRHTLYAYARLPQRYADDDDAVADLIEQRIEAFAPGFSRCVLARHHRSPAQIARDNPSLVGGDIAGGSMELDQQLVFRPAPGAGPSPHAAARPVRCELIRAPRRGRARRPGSRRRSRAALRHDSEG